MFDITSLKNNACLNLGKIESTLIDNRYLVTAQIVFEDEKNKKGKSVLKMSVSIIGRKELSTGNKNHISLNKHFKQSWSPKDKTRVQEIVDFINSSWPPEIEEDSLNQKFAQLETDCETIFFQKIKLDK